MTNWEVNMCASPETQSIPIQVIDSAGWTHVRKGVRRQKDQTSVSKDLTKLAPTHIPDGLTLDQVEKKMHMYMKTWKASECHGRINRILERIIMQEPTMSINQCIVLGIGSFTGGSSVEASMWELVALRSILKTLGKNVPHERRNCMAKRTLIEKQHAVEHIYLQDPCFNRLDIEILTSLGYVVLQTPEAFKKMTDTTFLYAPRMETRFIATALEQAQPSLYIGNDLSMWVHGLVLYILSNVDFIPCTEVESYCRSFIHLDKMTSMQSKTCEDFLKERTSVQLPDFDRDNWCLSQRIYWRESDAD